MEYICLYFVDSKESDSTSYYLNGGESPWEGKLEADNHEITADYNNEKLETSNISKTQEMVRQHLFFILLFNITRLNLKARDPNENVTGLHKCESWHIYTEQNK